MLRTVALSFLLSTSLTINSLAAYPNLQFLVIVNPNSGPGAAPWWPTDDYVREIPRLNTHPNVDILGYVRATYCTRPLADVFDDIDMYATWSLDDEHQGLGVQGIFVDETVNLYSTDAKQYLDEIDQKVKTTEGIGGDGTVRCMLYYRTT